MSCNPLFLSAPSLQGSTQCFIIAFAQRLCFEGETGADILREVFLVIGRASPEKGKQRSTLKPEALHKVLLVIMKVHQFQQGSTHGKFCGWDHICVYVTKRIEAEGYKSEILDCFHPAQCGTRWT